MQREGKSGAEARKAPASDVSPTSAVCSFPCAKARSWEGFGEARPGRAASWPGLCAIAPGHRAGALPLWKLTRSIPIQLASSRSQPASSLPRLETGLPGLGTKHCLELSAQGLVPLCWCCDREPKRLHKVGPQTTSTHFCSGGQLQGSPVWQELYFPK